MSEHAEIVFFCSYEAQSFYFGFAANGLQLFCAIGFMVTEKTVCYDVYPFGFEAVEELVLTASLSILQLNYAQAI